MEDKKIAFNWSDPAAVQTARQKAIQAGYKPADVDKFITGKRDEQAQIQLAQQGNLPDATYQDLAKNSPQAALQIAQSGYKPAMSAADKKKDETSKGLLGLTDSLKQLYNEPMANGQRPNATSKESLAKGGTGFMAPLNGALFDFSQVMTNRNVNAKSYKRAKEGFTASLKQLTGDTGVLTDQDFGRIAQSLPSFSDSDATAKGAWQTIDQILKSKLGSTGQYSYLDEAQAQSPQAPQGQTQSGFPQGSIVPGNNPSMPAQPGLAVQAAQQRAQQQQPQGKGIFESVFGPQGPIGGALAPLATSSAGDLAAGLFETIDPRVANIAHKSAQNQPISGDEYAGAAGDVAANVAGPFGPFANAVGGGIHGLTTPGASVGERLQNGAVDAATYAALAKLPGLPGMIKNKLIPTKAGGVLRDAAVETAEKAGKSINGGTIFEDLQKWAQTARKANPGKEKQIGQVINSAEQQFKDKKITPKEAFDIWKEVDSGFKANGVSKTTIESSSDRAMRGSLRKLLDAAAPGFEKGTGMIATGLGRSKGLKQTVLNPVTGAAIGIPASVAIYALLDKLGIGGGPR